MSSYLEVDLLIDFNYIQNKSVDYIRNDMHLNISQFVDMVNNLRNKDLAKYRNQLIDIEYYSLISFWSRNYVG